MQPSYAQYSHRSVAFIVGTGMGLICQQVITLSLCRLGWWNTGLKSESRMQRVGLFCVLKAYSICIKKRWVFEYILSVQMYVTVSSVHKLSK